MAGVLNFPCYAACTLRVREPFGVGSVLDFDVAANSRGLSFQCPCIAIQPPEPWDGGCTFLAQRTASLFTAPSAASAGRIPSKNNAYSSDAASGPNI